jgi:hypothetical protein
MNTEDRLTEALIRHAHEMDGRDARLDQVLARAGAIRRRRRTVVTALAAAAVIAITVPTTVLLHPGGRTTPLPAHHGTPQPSPTQTGNPTTTPNPTKTRGPAPTLDDLAGIPRGSDTFLNYVDADGVVHSNGAISHLPGTMDPSTQFVSRRGGWLVAGADNQLREYDSTGSVVASGRFGGMVVTADRTQAAWIMGDKLFQSGLSTMGEAVTPKGLPVPTSASLVGYVQEGVALSGDGGSIRIATGSGSLKALSVGLFPTTTSQATDLVGGTIGTPAQGNVEGAVYDLQTHARLWHNDWMPLRFSDDGTLVAAFPAGENGDPSTIAILDARTGKVIAHTPKLTGLYLGRGVAWDQHRILIPTSGGVGTTAALLALDTSGRFTRASGIEKSAKAGGAYLIFDAQP